MSSPVLSVVTVLSLVADPACGGAPRESELALRSVATTTVESGRRIYVLNVNGPAGGARQFATAGAAIAYARGLDAQKRNYDAGLFQINVSNFGRHGLTVETAFDPCLNTRAGVAHLRDDFDAALRAGHSRYNTGSLTAGIQNGYTARIERLLPALRIELQAAQVTLNPRRDPHGPPQTAPEPTLPAVSPGTPDCRVPSWDVWAQCLTQTPPAPPSAPPVVLIPAPAPTPVTPPQPQWLCAASQSQRSNPSAPLASTYEYAQYPCIGGGHRGRRSSLA